MDETKFYKNEELGNIENRLSGQVVREEIDLKRKIRDRIQESDKIKDNYDSVKITYKIAANIQKHDCLHLLDQKCWIRVDHIYIVHGRAIIIGETLFFNNSNYLKENSCKIGKRAVITCGKNVYWALKRK